MYSLEYRGFLALMSLSILWASCDEQHATEQTLNADAPDAPSDTGDAQRLEQALIAHSWSWRNITAALCNDDRYTWTFRAGGLVDYTVSSDRGHDPNTGLCQTSTTTTTGSFSIDAQGIVHTEVDGVIRKWPAAVFDAVPVYQGPDIAPDPYRTANNIMTTKAFRSSDGRTFPQTYINPLRYSSDLLDLSTALTFDAAPAQGDCRFDVSVVARLTDSANTLTEATDGYTLSCRVEPTGIDDWMAIILTETVPLATLPSDAPQVEREASYVRYQFSSANQPALYYRSGEPNLLVYQYDGCCDDVWMDGTTP